MLDLFHKKIHNVNFFVKKKKYHAAAGESGHCRAQTLSLPTHRVTRVSNVPFLPNFG
jgi:hypothetical protein